MTDYAPRPGDIVWTDFDPQLGREQAGRRPALVLSPVEFWQATRFVFVAPITSRVRPFPSSVVLPADLAVTGEVMLGQTRSIDTLARPIRFAACVAPPDLLDEARAKVAILLGI